MNEQIKIENKELTKEMLQEQVQNLESKLSQNKWYKRATLILTLLTGLNYAVDHFDKVKEKKDIMILKRAVSEISYTADQKGHPLSAFFTDDKSKESEDIWFNIESQASKIDQVVRDLDSRNGTEAEAVPEEIK